MSRYTVLEWNSLKFAGKRANYGKGLKHKGDNEEVSNWINPRHARRISATADKLPISKQISGGVLNYHHNRISAKNAVGIIQSDKCSLEILPKIDDIDTKGKISNTRKKLIKMIGLAQNFKIDVGSVTSLEWQNNTILEILIGIFANKLVDAVRRGLPQKYTEFEDDLPILKGSLDITRQFTVHAMNPSKLACQYDEFSHDNPLNQVMKLAINLLTKISRSSKNQKLLGELTLIFADVSLVEFQKLKWESISLDRTNSQWKELVSLAKFFLKRQYQTTTQSFSSDSIEGFALLFDMNKLFEKYVARMIQKVAANLQKSGKDIEVLYQKKGEHCLKDLNFNEEKFSTKPDIIVKIDKNNELVIDTKWKRIEAIGSKVWKNVNNGDFYQMMAYGKVYASPRVTIIYPHISQLGVSGYLLGTGKFRKIGDDSIPYEGQLEVYSFDLTNEKKELEHLKKLVCGELKCRKLD